MDDRYGDRRSAVAAARPAAAATPEQRRPAGQAPLPSPSSFRPFALAALGGVLHFFGFVGFGIWPLALIAYVPLWLAFESDGVRLGAAALIGFVFGWVSYAGGFLWVWRSVDVLLHGNVLLGATLLLADSAWFAGRYVVYAALYRLVRRRGWPVTAAALPTLVVVEWLYPLLFPVYYGHALAAGTTFVQVADLGGPLLLTAFVVALNLAAFETWRWGRGERERPAAVWAASICLIAAFWGYGRVRIASVDAAIARAPTLRVGIVQGNLGTQEKGVTSERDHSRYLEQTRALLAAGPVDLVVWPETVFTDGLRGPLPISGDLVRDDVAVPLLFGAAFVRTDTGPRVFYNAALLVGADGIIHDAYAKNLLIPFSEYVPLSGVVPLLASHLHRESHFAAAKQVPTLALGPWRIATPIGYEAVRPAFVRRMMLEGRPQLLVTLANDGWFGTSQEPALHLAMASLRAVEHRRSLVRAANNGISAVIDPAGRQVGRTGLLTRENLRASVPLLDETTLYTQWGDWFGWVCGVFVIIALVPARRWIAIRRRSVAAG